MQISSWGCDILNHPIPFQPRCQGRLIRDDCGALFLFLARQPWRVRPRHPSPAAHYVDDAGDTTDEQGNWTPPSPPTSSLPARRSGPAVITMLPMPLCSGCTRAFTATQRRRAFPCLNLRSLGLEIFADWRRTRPNRGGQHYPGGGNNDQQLFTNFLAGGGHLYLQGENGGFYGRVDNLEALWTDGQPLAPWRGRHCPEHMAWTNLCQQHALQYSHQLECAGHGGRRVFQATWPSVRREAEGP